MLSSALSTDATKDVFSSIVVKSDFTTIDEKIITLIMIIIISVIIDVRPVPRVGKCHGWFEQSLGCTSDWLKRGSRSLWKAPGLHG